MKIDDVKPTKKSLTLARAGDVDALEATLWVTFPPGYRDYVTRLGEGTLASTVRIYPPWRVEKELGDSRRRINKYWFWDDGCDVLPKERALECIVVGDTLNGDELVFHPARPGGLLILPRDSETVFEAGNDLLSAVEWMLMSEELGGPVEGREFEPFDSREEGGAASEDSGDPEGESLEAIVEMARRWGERHAARKAAQKAAKAQAKKGQETKRLYEAVVLDGEFTYGSGYTVAYAINDKSSGKTVGVFRWHSDGDSEGSSFEPVK
jgi:hypothetical protein